MTVREILAQWLKEHGFDGLYSDDECACLRTDLFVCEGPCDRCQPGYKTDCPPDCDDHEWHIGPEKKDTP